MTDIELKSCIGTIEMLRRLHGVMNVIDAGNCEKIIKVLSDISKYKDAYNKGWDDGAKATYEHLKMCEEEQEISGDLISRQAVLDALYELCDTGETLIENPWRDNPHIDALVDAIEQLPPVNPQPCEDSNANQHYSNALNALEVDAISRQAVNEIINDIRDCISVEGYCAILERLKKLPSVKQEPKTGHCKDCKYFEYDSVAKVDGIPLIVAHEICSRWSDGCKTKEDGYCFLFEPQERSDKE